MTRPLTLGVETSCDDTACAVVDAAGRVLSSVVSSQLRVHAPYGGVVPELASREHLANWPRVLESALEQAGIELADIDRVAATRGPGLVGSLLVGLNLGKAIAFGLGRPFFAVHHLEGHLFSPYLHLDARPAEPLPPRFIGLVVSGGHTSLVRVQSAGGTIEALGATRDDAMGEALDKIGKRLGLPFPGGPHVDRIAELANLGAARTEGRGTRFKVARCGDSLDFSYSGLKSQALREIERLEARGVATRARIQRPIEGGTGQDADPALGLDPAAVRLLAEFRRAAVLQVIDRLERLRQRQRFEALAVSGGVAACVELRRELATWCEERGVELALVPLRLSGDNAAMIAFAAAVREATAEGATPGSGAVGAQPDWSTPARSRLMLGTPPG